MNYNLQVPEGVLYRYGEDGHFVTDAASGSHSEPINFEWKKNTVTDFIHAGFILKEFVEHPSSYEDTKAEPREFTIIAHKI